MELNKRKSVKKGGILVIIFILVYIPSLVHWIYGKTISTDMIRMGSIEDSINTEGFLVRDEEIMKSPFEGKCIPNVSDGEKVPANFTVATILKDSTKKMYDDLNDLELRILKVQKEKSENQEFFSQDIARLENEVNKRVQLLIEQGNNNSISKARALKDDINGILQKKAEIIGNRGPADAFLNSLMKDREKLKQQINANKGEIITKSPGIICYTVDGYESMLNPAGIRNLTPKMLEGIKTRENVKSFSGKSVELNKPFAKLIKDFEYFVVFSLECEKAKDFKVDDGIRIRINDINKVMDTSIYYKSNLQDGRYILAVKVDKGISETAGLRKASVDIIKKSYDGYKVPLKSLSQIDQSSMTAKITLVKANYASIRDIRIKGMNEEFAVIESSNDAYRNGVGLYDMFVLNPQNIQEGQLINQ